MGNMTDIINEGEVHEDEDKKVASVEKQEAIDEWEERSMTWGEFKTRVEAAGITDNMTAAYIDWDDGHDPSVLIYKDKVSFRVE